MSLKNLADVRLLPRGYVNIGYLWQVLIHSRKDLEIAGQVKCKECDSDVLTHNNRWAGIGPAVSLKTMFAHEDRFDGRWYLTKDYL